MKFLQISPHNKSVLGIKRVLHTKPSRQTWMLSDHACRLCFGRVLQRMVKGNIVEVRCAECGKHAEGDPTVICCCGADCGSLGRVLECFKNPHITPANPQEIMVRERMIGNT